ncbi:hypothetical protein N7G274_001067 [Stereocaulon virgatum]|uniref:Basic proline-rich protein n=1 Tax=Stereocaulon virgatum TaxID=373712 RepID=A0ABR4ANC2_9LECA
MIRRSTIIFAASLALLSTLEPATCFAAAAPAPNRDELERPRFVRKEIKRFVIGPRNGTTTTGLDAGNGPGGERPSTTSPLDTLTDSLTTPAVAESPTHTRSDQLGDHSGQTTTDHTASPSSSMDITSDHGTTPEFVTTAAAASSTHASSHSQESTNQGPSSQATQADSSTANTNTDTAGATSNTGKTNTDTVKQPITPKSQTLDTSPADTSLGLPTTSPFTKTSGTQNTDTKTGQSAGSSQSGDQGPGGISSVLSPVIVPSVTPSIGNGPTKQTDTRIPSSGPESTPSHRTNINDQSTSHELGATPVQPQSSASQTTLPNAPGAVSSVTPVQPDTRPASSTGGAATTLPHGGNDNQSPIAEPTVTPTHAAGSILPSLTLPGYGDTTAAASTAASAMETNTSNGNAVVGLPGAQSSGIPLPASQTGVVASATVLGGGVHSGESNAAASNTGSAETTKAGSVFSTQEVNLPIPTGSALYTALTHALGSVPGDGSTMLPNGVVVPTAAQTINAGGQLAGSTVSDGLLVPISPAGAHSTTVPVAAQATNAGGQLAGSTVSDGLLVPISPAGAHSTTVPVAAQATGAGGQLAGSTVSDGLLVPISPAGAHSTTEPAAAQATSAGGQLAGSTVSDGLLVPVISPVGAHSTTVPAAAQATSAGGQLTGFTVSNGLLVPIVSPAGAHSTTVPAAAQATSAGGQLTGFTVSDGLLVPISPAGAHSNTMPAAAQATSAGGQLAGFTVSDGLLVPVVPTSAVSIAAPPSVPSEGSLPPGYTVSDGLIVSISHTAVALPSTVPPANTQSDLAGLTLSDGLLVPISTVAALPTLPPLTNSNGIVIPAASATVPVIPTAYSEALTNTAVAPLVPVLTNSDGSIIPNPAVATNTNLPSIPVSPVVPFVTASSVNLVPNPAAATNTALPPLVPASTDSNGSILPNPADATNTALAPIALTSLAPTVTAPTGTVPNTGVPLPAATTNAAIPASTGLIVGSSTLSNGAVVPITAGGVLGSSTQSNGNVVPITAAAASAASGFTTLPNGSVVPVSNAPAQASTPLPNGSAIPVASVQETSQGTPAVAQPSTVAPAVQSFPTDAKGPFTQQPIGYDSLTTQSIPTNIIVQPSISGSGAASSTGSMATGLPTGVPLILYPPQGPKQQPENTDMIQIGFKYPLNYDFVWTHNESQQQIFKYLPLGISYGLNIDPSNVTMQTLRAWDTTRDLHYITTLALAWIPSGLVDTLSLLVQTRTSRFYTNPDDSTNTLLSMINNAIPIPADNSTDGGSSLYGSQPTSSASAKTNGSPIGGDIGNSQPVRPSSIGIGVGVAAGAAAYGAAMFFVARRYKKRRQSHGRSPSMFNSPVMSHIGPDAGAGAALMSGGIDRSISPYHDEDGRAGSRGSGRSGSTGRQQISAPVMAENSLGWN